MKGKTKAEILAELGNLPAEIYDKLVEKFKTISADQLDRLEECVKTGNTAEGGDLAHSMKGAAANLRLEPIYARVIALEKDIKAGKQLPAIAPKLTALRKLVEKL
ncbi:MAG: Hpt domain-containing protein [Elusimicrobiaceae bacterium]|nr:Hpt domain-containing protein [Elusimicrobiaceae bacterium]